LFWKAKLRQLKGVPIDEEVLSKMQEIHEIECPEEIDLSQVQQHLKDAISK